ncbi:MAG: class I SAM-dependent methyltransferase [Methylobacter sp.]|nr:class I SAM-dependent methyltransferase [Methylobacter sp.]
MPDTHPNSVVVHSLKPDIAANPIYPALARATLFELHSNLLNLLGKGLSQQPGPKNLVVVGPGSEALPFSENIEVVTTLLNGGNLILLDYNPDICALLPAYLESKGFALRFNITRSQNDNLIDPSGLHNTIVIKQWNIANGFPFPDSSIDAIDMTVSMHHVTPYTSDISDLFRQARKPLKPGAVLHLGEGDVDMKYSERKINKLASDMLDARVRGVWISDARNADSPPRQWHIGNETAEVAMKVSPTGMVSIHHADVETVSSHLLKSHYKQMHLGDETIVLPLIDHAMEEDFQNLIVPVRAYYEAIAELCLQHLDPSYHTEFSKALFKEQSDAVRGIVEYYSSPATLCDALITTGFKIDEIRHTINGPFVNILSINQ